MKLAEENTMVERKGDRRQSNFSNTSNYLDESQRSSIGGIDDYGSPAPSSDLLYLVDDVPPWYLCIFLGLQHYLTMVSSAMAVPLLLAGFLCMDKDDPARGYLVCTIIFVSGLITLLQSTFGVRLPIVQGGTFTFVSPTIAILGLAEWKCPAAEEMATWSPDQKEEEWQRRMREIQGAIIVSALFQVVGGMTGLFGLVLSWITPLTIAPMVASIGLSLVKVTMDHMSSHWGISILTTALIILFSQYLRNLNIPVPRYSLQERKHSWVRVPVFKLFPVLLAIMISWFLCWVLTVTDVFPAGSAARTDANINILDNSPWFRFPYPGQWGAPTVSLAAVLGMVAGVIPSAIESIGDYYACAKLSGAPPPPPHAINRGLLIEGLGCMLAGVWGTGNGTTSYSENVGAIGVTKVGSRRVIQVGAIIMIVLGLFGKFGALCVTIPTPVIGGVFCVTFSIVTSMGLSATQYVDLNSARNLFILGFSIFFALVLPAWVVDSTVIETGSKNLNQIVTVLLKTNMLIAGTLGFFLDNTIPGTPEERGIIKWREGSRPKSEDEGVNFLKSYDLPFGNEAIRRQKWTRFIPFSPSYDFKIRLRKKKDSIENTDL